MLTYDISKKDTSLYIQIYEYIKKDIENGNIKAHQKLPSKRSLAQHHNISTITVQNAYLQLYSEGYIYSKERSGYFAYDILQIKNNSTNKLNYIKSDFTEKSDQSFYSIDISESSINKSNFPFHLWNKEMREVMASKQGDLLAKVPSLGLWELRKAIAEYLYKFRALQVDPNNILIGAGTEYLYSMLVKLLGRNNTVAVEYPCYKKINYVYNSEGIKVKNIHLDSQGLNMNELYKSKANILHISPAHNFPSGIVMPISRRLEILEWLNKDKNRFIIEDEYDSEFRFMAKPLESLFSKDSSKKTIYMNTFSKTLAPNLRISYMILPEQLIEKYNKILYFTTCPVCSFEQHILAQFIAKGNFERHINRMRKKYKIHRDEILTIIHTSALAKMCEIKEELSGLHFILKLKTKKKDQEIKELAREYGIKTSFLSDFYDNSLNIHNKEISKERVKEVPRGELIINYSGIDVNSMKKFVNILFKIIK